jgi:hypothetical protein
MKISSFFFFLKKKKILIFLFNGHASGQSTDLRIDNDIPNSAINHKGLGCAVQLESSANETS